MTKKKAKKQSAAPFIMMAVFAYLAGFPIWLVIILALVGFVVWKANQNKNALSKLPLPKDIQSSPAEESQPKPKLTREQRKLQRQLEQMAKDRLDEIALEAETAKQQPTEELAPPPEHKPKRAKQSKPETAPAPDEPAMNALTGTLPSARGQRVHPLALSLRSRGGARQAIIAMTVLGKPRSTEPYEFEPQNRGDITPSRGL